ncbi:helix-turn-helix domain-containing protein [Amycolatopsis pigmentata]|uniref:Helix-turn-helix domain-containing protein n=1 Tax=Amycolatopsis pigmentata TaxID=450801 RepID=A0ABW5G4I7_9PSEU
MGPNSFLRLLVDGAPASDYEDALRTALAGAASGEEHDRIVDDHRLALRARDLLEQHQSREAAQRALLECAMELADVPSNVNAMLTSIVTRAQRLLGCDLAYLSLNDPERSETYVRVMVGATSSCWKDIRIPFGAGIGGKVAATATPFATSDYFHDERLAHDPVVDKSARAEGQAAILGVPLVHRGRVIGVLFASNRRLEPFPHESIVQLSSLATLAAIAIHQAKLLEEKETANTTLRARARETERAVTAHDRSMEIVLRGGGVQEVVNATTETLDGTLAIFDEQGTTLAWTPDTPEKLLQAMLSATQGDRDRGVRSAPAGNFWVTTLAAGREDLGSLVWAPSSTASDADRRILERAGVVAALVRLFHNNVANAEARVRGELLDDLLSPTATTYTSLADRAQRLGYEPDTPHIVVVAHIEPALRQRLATNTSDLAVARSGLSTTRDGFAVVVLPAGNTALTAKQVSGSLTMRLGAPVTTGAAGPVDNAAELPTAYTEALACTRALLRLGRIGDSATVDELGYTGLLLGDSASATTFIGRTLGPVIDHDARRGTTLLSTLETYFATGQSLATSAKQLHVHPNTITQRLDRVKRLLGVDWSDPEQALDLQLALRLRRISWDCQ